jgi:putative transposase
MDDYESLSHSKRECKYHVVFIPKCRRKTLYLELRRHLGDVFRKLAEQKESKIEEGHLLLDHVHMFDLDPTEVRSVAGDRIYQGKECDTLGSCIRREEAEFCGPALLGEGILRIHSRTGHRGNTRVHQEAGRGGQAPGADESVALMSHL